MKATKSISALSCLAGLVWGGRLKTIRALYQAILIPQITYNCLVWYSPLGLPGRRKYILKLLQIIQGRISRVVTGSFKATSLPAFDIEAFLLLIRLRLEKLASESFLQIASSQIHETIINKHPKSAQLKQLLPLENLIRQFEKRSGLKTANFERTVPFIVPL